MPGLSQFQTVTASYDTVAADYADLVRDALLQMPLDRDLLGTFAELVQGADIGPVADIGCGPGHVAWIGSSPCVGIRLPEVSHAKD